MYLSRAPPQKKSWFEHIVIGANCPDAKHQNIFIKLAALFFLYRGTAIEAHTLPPDVTMQHKIHTTCIHVC